jgi:uncharacterized protein with von Willebrand factor type A (vWA) domain
VELKRKQREEAFRRMEIESLLVNDQIHLTEHEQSLYRTSYEKYSVEDLLEMIDGKQSKLNIAQRKIASELLIERLGQTQYGAEETALFNLSLRQLYDVTLGKYEDATDYQIHRASEILDEALLRASSVPNL